MDGAQQTTGHHFPCQNGHILLTAMGEEGKGVFVVPLSGDSMCKLTGKLLTPSGPSRNGCPAGPQRMGQNWPGEEQFGYHSVPSFIVGQWKMVCCVEIPFRANCKWPGHSTMSWPHHCTSPRSQSLSLHFLWDPALSPPLPAEVVSPNP